MTPAASTRRSMRQKAINSKGKDLPQDDPIDGGANGNGKHQGGEVSDSESEMDLIDFDLNSTDPLSDRSPNNKEGYSGHQFEALKSDSEDSNESENSEDYYPKKRRATEWEDTRFSESLADVKLTIMDQTKRHKFFFHDGITLAAAQEVYGRKRAASTERQQLIDDDRIQMIFRALDESFGKIKEELAPKKTGRDTSNSAWEEP